MTATRSSAHFFGSPFRNPGKRDGSRIIRRIGVAVLTGSGIAAATTLTAHALGANHCEPRLSTLSANPGRKASS
jgi:hypothetical protein